MANGASISIVGNLFADAVSRQAGNSTVTEFRMPLPKPQNAAQEDNPVSITVSIWGNRGTSLLPYLTKGKQVFVTGTLTAGFRTGNDGRVFTNLYLNAADIVLLGDPQRSVAPAPAAYDEVPF